MTAIQSSDSPNLFPLQIAVWSWLDRATRRPHRNRAGRTCRDRGIRTRRHRDRYESHWVTNTCSVERPSRCEAKPRFSACAPPGCWSLALCNVIDVPRSDRRSAWSSCSFDVGVRLHAAAHSRV